MVDMIKGCWLEVEFECPKGWTIAAESGGLTEAYMRIDSKTAPKFEIKWERIKKGAKIYPHTIVDNFIETYKKKSVKRKTKVEILESDSLKVCEHKAVFTRWKALAEAVTMAWVCNEENKAFLLGYYLEPGEQWASVASWLVPGIVCHTANDYWRYRLLGTEFKVKKGYWISKRVFMVGKVTLLFKNRDGASLLLHWSSFAKELLAKNQNLIKWFRREGPKEVKEVIKDVSGDKLRLSDIGSEAFFEKELSKGLMMKKVIREALRLWHDSTNNRIFLTCYSGPEDTFKDLEFLEGSIVVELE